MATKKLKLMAQFDPVRVVKRYLPTGGWLIMQSVAIGEIRLDFQEWHASKPDAKGRKEFKQRARAAFIRRVFG